MARVASRTLPLTRYDRGAGRLRRRVAAEQPSVQFALATSGRFVYNSCMKRQTGNGLLLDRILEPVSSSLNEEAARKLLDLKADRKTQARVAKLADKCNDGDLTPDERREYELYVMAGHFVAILKAKARILLARKGQPA